MNEREPLVIADADDTPDNWSYSISSSMESLLVEDDNDNDNGNDNQSQEMNKDSNGDKKDKKFESLKNGGLSIDINFNGNNKENNSNNNNNDIDDDSHDSQLINRSKSKKNKKINGNDNKDYASSSIDILSNDSEQLSSNIYGDNNGEDDDEQNGNKINTKGSIPISRMKSSTSTNGGSNNVSNSLSSSISNSSMSFISKPSLANPETTKSDVLSYSTTHSRGNHNGIPDDGIGFLPAQITGSASVSESSTSLLPGLTTSSTPSSIEINRNSTKETLEAISKSHEIDLKNNGGDSNNSPHSMTPTNSILSKISTSVASFTNRASVAPPLSSPLSQFPSSNNSDAIRNHQRTASADNATLNNSHSHINGSRRHSISNINKEIAIPEEETISGTPTTASGQLETTIGVSGTPDMMSYRRSRSRRTTRSSSSAATAAAATNKSPMVDGQGSPKTPVFASGSGFINNQQPQPQPQPQPQLTPITPTTPKITTTEPSFDRNLYTEEKYLDTQYRYAALKRNADFHILFPNIPSDDRLLDDFSCALSREFLIQGRLYISEHYLGFNSNFLGWVTNVVISHDDILNFEKKVTAGFFPNGIVIDTKDSKYNFASFMSRDATFNFLETIWSKSVALSKSRNENSRDIDLLIARVVSHDSLVDNGNSNNNLLSEEDVFTIDEDSPEDYSGRGGLNTPLNGSSFSLNEQFTQKNSNLKKTNGNSEKQQRKKQKKKKIINHDNEIKIINNPDDKNFKFEYKGPNHFSKATEIKYDVNKEKANLLFDEEFDVPIGLLFNIIFGKNTDFHKKLMSENECFDFSEYSEFNIKKGDDDNDRDDDEDFISKRKFTYQRNLGFAIGPASTNVECEEIIKLLDYKDSIEVLSITRTPNVPSGGVFTVQTRYDFAWAGNDKSRLQLSYKVVWTGSSWIKSMVESSTSGGQNKVANDLKNNLNNLLDSNIVFIKKKIKEYDESEESEGEGEEENEDIENALTATESSGNLDQETLKDEEKPVTQVPSKSTTTTTTTTTINGDTTKSEDKKMINNNDWISSISITNILIIVIILIQIIMLREIFIIKSVNNTDFQLIKLIKNFKINDNDENEYNDEDLIKLIKLLKRSIE